MTSSNITHFRIPRRSEIALALPTGKKGTADPKPYIERALDDDNVVAQIERYKTNGGATGHWRLDDVRTMDIILAFDKKNGNGILSTGMTEYEILAQINVVLRRRYTLVAHKIVGLSEKWMLTNAPKAPPAAADLA